MTTAIIHGDPGSFKTATLVSDYLVPAVKQGRLIITNIRGVKPLKEIADSYKFELPSSAQIINVSFDKEGFRKMAKFFHWAPPGALILMDEVQRIYPTRMRNFVYCDYPDQDDETRPHTVEDAFDSHRHYNWDIYMSTPNIAKVHGEIREVAEFGYRHKNLATLFAFLKGRYKRVVHLATNSGTAMNHTVSASLKKIDVRCFNVYQSTATGKTKDTTSSVSFFKQPRVIILLLVIAYSCWNFFSTIHAAGGVPSMFGGSVHASGHTTPKETAPASTQAAPGIPAGAVLPGQPLQNPFAGLDIYLAGKINQVHWFLVVYPDHSTQQFTQDELLAIGFKIANLSERVIKLSYNADEYIVMPRPLPQYQPQPSNNAQILTNQPLANL